MAKFTLSRMADEDLVNIYSYGFQKHGREQAEIYTRDLYSRFDLLARFPGMGIAAKVGNIQCLKFPTGHHVIYYIRLEDGILIGRILGNPMDPAKHEFDL
jgi:toxin ParE1/3/4